MLFSDHCLEEEISISRVLQTLIGDIDNLLLDTSDSNHTVPLYQERQTSVDSSEPFQHPQTTEPPSQTCLGFTGEFKVISLIYTHLCGQHQPCRTLTVA